MKYDGVLFEAYGLWIIFPHGTEISFFGRSGE